MTIRNVTDRARDIELVSDAITNAIKVALPAMVRREVELQLARYQEPSIKSPDVTPGSGARS